MKVSIVTIAFNSGATIKRALESVAHQTYKNIEHIVIDGASSDDTLDIVRSFAHVAYLSSEADTGIYNAMNKGVRRSTGDVIGILNSDDFLADDNVVSRIVQLFESNSAQVCFGAVEFVRPNNLNKVVRLFTGAGFQPWMFRFGIMPPHPSFYVRREMYTNYGDYKESYKITADFEWMIRLLYHAKISPVCVSDIWVRMRTGGASNNGWRARLLLNREMVRACGENGIISSLPLMIFKYLFKIFQLRPLGRR